MTTATRLLATIAVLAATLTGPAAQAADFGANVEAPHAQRLRDIEQVAGRQVDSTRMFLRWDSPWPHDLVQVKDRVRLMISVQAIRADGTRISYADIANAQPGSPLYGDMQRWARAIRDLGVPVTFTFNHEPEVLRNAASGTPADYIAAWRKFRTIIRNHTSNARFSWIMTANAFNLASTDSRYAPKWYPGDPYVDVIAADAYNWFTCRGNAEPWRSLQQLTAGMIRFGDAHPGKALYLTEWGSVEDPANPYRKATWINEARAWLKTTRIEGVSWFALTGAEGPACDWMPQSSPQALQAWRAMGADPYFGGGK